MPPPPTALITDPTAIAGTLTAIIAALFWVSGVARIQRLFEVIPVVLLAYFLPTIATAVRLIPPQSPAYDWITQYMLTLALFLLMVTVDLRSVVRLGPMALIMMLAGSLGIMIGAPLVLILFGPALPPDAWKGIAALAGSWIGGSANMVAVAESVGTPDALFGPMIIVDTIVGYGWMAILLFLSAWQSRFDRWNHARTGAIEETNRHLAELDAHRVPLDLRSTGLIVLGGFAAATLAVAIGQRLPELGNPKIISHTTWTVLLVVTVGLILSLTPMRRLEERGASRIGYAALYLMMAAIGAQADLRAVLEAPVFLLVGVVWIGIHVGTLLIVARLIRAPLFFVATGSMANVGGTASAPVVATMYHPAMAPVGLLMAVLGYVVGTYAGLGLAWFLGQIAT
ncbi:MAG: DUF819 family protein [Gemmatimonadota bacterium]|nr:DUF819 family protein [Gemmatimonadota bacterium]MDH5197147.1 DUF819 family protein [Gemmatimonadota bacterium]